jgi:hypothetical protein
LGVAGLTPEQATRVLARIGDHTITLGEYAVALEHMDQFDRMRYQSAERRKELLNEMIDVTLLADEARARGYDRDPIAQQEIREILRDAVLKQSREGVPPPNEVAEDEVRSYYDAHRGDFRDPERRRVSAIVLGSQSAADAALEIARKAKTQEWGELVRTRSTDSQSKADVPSDLAGDFGFVAPPGDPRGDNPRVPEEVRSGVFEIAVVGDVLPRPVKARGKYYVVKLAGKTEPHDRSLQEAERMIRVKLSQAKARAKEDELLDSLRTRFPVTIDEEALRKVTVSPILDAGAEAP